MMKTHHIKLVVILALASFLNPLTVLADQKTDEKVKSCLTETANLDECFHLVLPLLSHAFYIVPERTDEQIAQNDIAKQILSLGCQNKHTNSCERLATQVMLYEISMEQLALPTPNAEHMQKGLPLLQRACDLNSAYACVTKAQAHLDFDLPAETKTAMALLRRACALNDGYGCLFLGENLYETEIPANLKEANQLFKKSCGLKDGIGCYSHARVLMNEEGETQKALDAFERGCTLYDGFACYELGTFYEEGKFFERDLKRAKYFYEQACEYSDDQGCDAYDRLD